VGFLGAKRLARIEVKTTGALGYQKDRRGLRGRFSVGRNPFGPSLIVLGSAPTLSTKSNTVLLGIRRVEAMAKAKEEAPAWAKGYSIEALKEHAALFKDAHKAHVYGAFGLIKERDLAEAMSRGEYSAQMFKQQYEAAAIWHELKSGSTQYDFTGRAIKLPRGAIYVKAFACCVQGAGEKLLARLTQNSLRSSYVEVFAEDKRAVAVVKNLGMRIAFTKVMAGSEIKMVYCRHVSPPPFLPAAEYETLRICRQKFLSVVEQRAIADEVAGFGRTLWQQHYSSYNKRESWTAFALRGYVKEDPGFIIKPAEMSKAWKDEHPALLKQRCVDVSVRSAFPATNHALRRIPAEFERVRFMRLAPKDGELSRHADITDRWAGTRDGYIMRLHIPIVTNPAVRFSAWNVLGDRIDLNFPPRSLCYLDVRKPHTVVNAGETERIHLVVDAIANPNLRRWFGMD
jgi:hypothetical protein